MTRLCVLMAFLSTLASCGDPSPTMDADVGSSGDAGSGSDGGRTEDVGGSDDGGGTDGGGTDTSLPDAGPIDEELKAFPGAFGAGAYTTTGGRGGQVIHVTNLNDSGAGSFREAMSVASPRIIVFDVSGEINLESRVLLSRDGGNDYGNLTIAGQTAPEGGITITGGRIYLIGNSNIIIRGIRFRNGETSDNGDCLTIPSGSNIVVDHCSFAWAKDEALDISANGGHTDITVQNCLFYENKTAMILGSDDEASYGSVSVLRNASANTSHRFPKAAGDIELDVINNLIHNWRYRTLRMDGFDYTLNHIGNYYQSGSNTLGSASNDGAGIHKTGTNATMSPRIWSRYNHIDRDILDHYSLSSYDAETNEFSAWSRFPLAATIDPNPEWFVSAQLPLQGAAPTIVEASALEALLLPTVGAGFYLNEDGTYGHHRDALDLDAVSLIETDGSRTYYLHADPEFGDNPTIPSNTRDSSYDTDRDGMADEWERAVFGDLERESTGDHDDDGYTNIEEFINLIDR